MITPAAEFRRWLVLASLLACASALTTWGMVEQLGIFTVHADVVIYSFWLVFAAVEGWVQFKDARRRWTWVLGGLVTACLVAYSDKTGALSKPSFVLMLFLAPALLETYAAKGARKRPWIWIIFTTGLYASLPVWLNGVQNLVAKVVHLLPSLAPWMGTNLISEFAAIFATILISRAAVGSFIASRIEQNPKPS